MVSDQGNQHNNGPHQDQIFDNPSVLCLALWAKNWIQFWLLGEEGAFYQFMKGVWLSQFLSLPIKKKKKKKIPC